MRTNDWFPAADGLEVRDLPKCGLSVRPSAKSATYPIGTEAAFYHPGVTQKQREAELASYVERRAREKGATTVFVSGPQCREIPQAFGEPHPLAIDGKVRQVYCYVAYVVPVAEAA